MALGKGKRSVLPARVWLGTLLANVLALSLYAQLAPARAFGGVASFALALLALDAVGLLLLERWLRGHSRAAAPSSIDRPESEEDPPRRVNGHARSGQPIQTASATGESSQARGASAALAESEARYRSLAESSSDYILRYDRDGRHVYVNAAAAKVTGVSVEEMLGKTHRDMGFPEELCLLWEKKIEGVFETGRATGEVFEWAGADGSVTLDWRVMPEFGVQGEVAFALGVSRDITALKVAEQERLSLERQLLHSQKLESLGVLAGGIAHDFNNILTAILGYAELIEQKLDSNSPLLDYAQSIHRSANHAATLTSQMLAYSGRASFSVQPLDLGQLVGELGVLLAAFLPKGTRLLCETPAGLPAVHADAAQLRQVIMNLIINAGEASTEGDGAVVVRTGTVVVEAGQRAQPALTTEIDPGEYVYLEVEDSGEGMDADTQERIFDPFYTTKFQGRGLGLAAVMGIVRGHAGGLAVHSEPGKGSTFRVLFPAATTAAPAEAAAPQRSTWTGSGTLLVIDDEEIVRSSLDDVLTNLGFDVFCAAGGEEGVQLLREHADSIALVLLDMTMPGMDGRETFVALREVRPDVRVVLCSGYSQEDSMSKFAESDLVGFLGKPFQQRTLVDCLRAALEGGA